jgi:hypothetical protein
MSKRDLHLPKERQEGNSQGRQHNNNNSAEKNQPKRKLTIKIVSLCSGIFKSVHGADVHLALLSQFS